MLMKVKKILMQHKHLIIAVTGASGSIYGYTLLRILADIESVKTHLIISKSANITIKQELDKSPDALKELADYNYNINDIAAVISSGSFITEGMIIAPASVKTLANIATGNSTNLIARAADVILKERRKLILQVRETPLNLIHLQNMQTVTQAGAIIAPPVPAFYNKPKTIDDLVFYSSARLLDHFAINLKEVKRWQGLN